jgi:phenylacetic acid degradation operon negative regulatory protein
MPVAALVAAAELFGIDGNALRVALARLLARELVVRDERGRYRLAEAALAVSARVSAWRRLSERLRPWRGEWVMVHGLRASGGRRADQEERARRLLGLAELTREVAVRPNNLRGGVAEVRDQLRALAAGPDVMVAALSSLDAHTEQRVRGLWDTSALVEGYRSSRRTLQHSALKLARLSSERRLVESFLVGGRVLRQLTLDPLLPEPMIQVEERKALVDELRGYDDLGRAQWAQFLAPYGITNIRGPVDFSSALESELRVSDGAG